MWQKKRKRKKEDGKEKITLNGPETYCEQFFNTLLRFFFTSFAMHQERSLFTSRESHSVKTALSFSDSTQQVTISSFTIKCHRRHNRWMLNEIQH